MKYTWIAQGGEELSTSRYRAFNRYRQMMNHEYNTAIWIGLEPDRWWVQDPPRELWDDVPGSTAIVQRIPYTDENAPLFQKVKRQARRVGFDLDDLPEQLVEPLRNMLAQVPSNHLRLVQG